MTGTPRLRCWDGKTQMAWVYDDGGRAAAGFKGRSADCVARAIAIATGTPYRAVYDALNALAQRERPRQGKARSAARTGVRKTIYRPYLEALGWRWVPTMRLGRGATVHLCEEELPTGRLIVSVSRHLTAVIDHVVHDSHDPQRAGVETVNGSDRIIRRCVYGYFTKSATRVAS